MTRHRLEDRGDALRLYIEEMAEFLYEDTTEEEAQHYGSHDESKFQYREDAPNRVMMCFTDPRYEIWNGGVHDPVGFYHCDGASIYTNLGRIGS